MILYWIIFLILSCLAFADWKKTVIIWASVQFLFNEGVCLKYSSPAVSFVLAFNTLLFIIYIFKRKQIKGLSSSDFIFKPILIFYLISYICSLLFSILPFSEAFTGSIKFFIKNFGMLYMLQKAISNKADIRLFIKTSLIVIICFVGLGIYESIFKTNPIQDYIYFHTNPDLLYGKTYYVPASERITGEAQSRFGAVRAYSFFDIHIAFGLTCVYFLYLFLYLYTNKLAFLKNQQYIICILSLIIGTLLCNSKTPMVGLVFVLYSFFNLKEVVKFRYIALILILVSFIYLYMPEYLNNFFALFDEKLAEEGGGSNLDMRIIQYEIGIKFFLENPLFGNGIQSISKALKEINPDILGAESSWIKISGERGILGLASYISMFAFLYKILNKETSPKISIGFVLCIIAMDTATGEGAFYNYGLITLVILKISRIKRIYTEYKLKKKQLC